MNTNNTHDTKCESTPEAPPNIKFLMEPTSILANLTAKLGCRLGELGTPDSIHRTGQTHWLDQLGSTEPKVLLVRRRLSPKLARSSKLRLDHAAGGSPCTLGCLSVDLETPSYLPEPPGCRDWICTCAALNNFKLAAALIKRGKMPVTFEM